MRAQQVGHRLLFVRKYSIMKRDGKRLLPHVYAHLCVVSLSLRISSIFTITYWLCMFSDRKDIARHTLS